MAKQRADIEAGRMFRLVEMLNMIATGTFSIPSIAAALDTSQRTVYRYIDFLHEVGFEIIIIDSGVTLGTNHYPVFISHFKKEVRRG